MEHGRMMRETVSWQTDRRTAVAEDKKEEEEEEKGRRREREADTHICCDFGDFSSGDATFSGCQNSPCVTGIINMSRNYRGGPTCCRVYNRAAF